MLNYNSNGYKAVTISYILLKSISDDTTRRSVRLFFFLDYGQPFNVVDIGHCHKPRANI